MTTPTNDEPSYDACLFGVVVALSIANATGVWLAATGAVHPPWGILNFFMFFAPTALSMLMTIFQAVIRPYPFSTWALAMFIVAMLVAVLVNFQFLLSALDAV